MARMPTWTELRLEAERLVTLHDECQNDVTGLMNSLPKLDRKILELNADKVIDTTLMWPIDVKNSKFFDESDHMPSMPSTSSPLPSPKVIEPKQQTSKQQSNFEQPMLSKQIKYRSLPEFNDESMLEAQNYLQSLPARTKVATKIATKAPTETVPINIVRSSPIVPVEVINYKEPELSAEDINEFDANIHEPLKSYRPYYATLIDIPYVKKRDRITDDNLPPTKSPKHNLVRSRTVDENLSKRCANTKSNSSKGKVCTKTIMNNNTNELDPHKLEHLKPLDRPLSEYYRMNRPKLAMRADQRAMYLRKAAEKRKYMAAHRITDSLERMRISSRNSNNTTNKNKQPNSKTGFAINKDYCSVVPEYQVKCKLSEQEMKKLTAKIYKRLPEVKRKHKEEVSKLMKIQNYKNKLEYGRKLLENRRRGVIDYTLRTGYEDKQSIESGSEFSSLTGNNYPPSGDVSLDSCY